MHARSRGIVKIKMGEDGLPGVGVSLLLALEASVNEKKIHAHGMGGFCSISLLDRAYTLSVFKAGPLSEKIEEEIEPLSLLSVPQKI